MKKLIIIIISFLLLWGGWYICYPYFLMWLEGFSFFSTLQDFVPISLHLPADVFHYMGSFLLQLYSSPVMGAAVQALAPIVSLLCIWLVVKRLFTDPDTLFWLPFLALPALVYSQLNDINLEKTCMILTVSVVLAAVIYLVTCFVKPSCNLPGFMHHKLVFILVPMLSVLLSLCLIKTGPLSSQHEDVARLTYMGRQGNWDEIIQTVSRKDALSDDYKKKYMLLALAQTDSLPEYAFKYGLKSSEDFIITDIAGPWDMQYNIQFYRMLGLHNAVIYYAYQQSLQSLPGICSDAVRTLADTYIELNDYTLAKKYVDLLSHSLCNGKWLREHYVELESIKGLEPEYVMIGNQFVLQDFYKDLSSLVTRYPDEKKYVDILLCGLLADKDGNTFMDVFDMVYEKHYKDAPHMPDVYQEALCLVASHEPEIRDIYGIDENVWGRYCDFSAMMTQGKVSLAKRKYADTYWVYSYK